MNKIKQITKVVGYTLLITLNVSVFIILMMVLFTANGAEYNLGNIRTSKHFTWKGQVGAKKGFVTFDTQTSAIRAMTILIKNYHNKYHINTVKSFTFRYSPPIENDTLGHTVCISKFSGIKDTFKLSTTDVSNLIKGITKCETGITLPIATVIATVKNTL